MEAIEWGNAVEQSNTMKSEEQLFFESLGMLLSQVQEQWRDSAYTKSLARLLNLYHSGEWANLETKTKRLWLQGIDNALFGPPSEIYTLEVYIRGSSPEILSSFLKSLEQAALAIGVANPSHCAF